MWSREIVVAAAVVSIALAGPVWAAGADKAARVASATGQGGPVPAPHAFDAGRVAGELRTEHIQTAIRKYFEREWGARVTAVQVTVIDPSAPIKVPGGTVELQVLPAAPDGVMGRRNVTMQVVAEGKLWKTMDVLVDLAAQVEVIVPNRAVKADEIIEAEDLTTVRVVTYDLKHSFVTDPELVRGKSAARPLQPHTPLRASFLKAPILVRKGDRVLIEAKRGGLSIQTTGITKGSGQVGQTVMVANLESGRELRAKIVAPGLVQVDF